MLKSALDTSVDVTKIIAPGIYPVTQGNASVPDSSAGLMTVVLTATSQKTTFQKEISSVVYSLINGKWKKPEPGDVGSFGTAAFCDVTTSTTDKTPGRVPTVGWMGNGKSIELFENSNLNNVTSVVATYSVNSVGTSPKNFPVNLPGVLRVSQDSDNRTIQEYTTFNPVVKYERALYSSGSWSGWTAYYSSNNKPTAVDVSALALSKISLSTGTDFNNAPAGSTSFAYSVALNSPPEHCAVIDWWGLNDGFRGQLGAGYTSGMVYFRARNGNTGTWSAWDRLYSVNNPPPYPNLSPYATRDWVDAQGYATKNWVLQNFVQSIDLTAPAEVGFWDGRGYPRATDGAAMYNFNMVGGSSNVGNFIIRYTRRLVNNVWYVLN